ncbi:hypothetical protein J7E91_32625 [Streptomyces sp. ISL-99]|uniref:hypothetical protein n=1 Tax=Streptomyces sp. ISL-99 TaxID=2819193 RepID=UPI001BE54564|nr:hypothetical protein [Streptomyces sp. ISL-99]MBT2529978.1 hypothetical protein [Streptomyces sp. ISL-99]
MFPGLAEIAWRCPDLHLAVLHLGGATLPGGLLVTMDAQQGADLVPGRPPAKAASGALRGVRRHARSPLSDFLAEADRRGFAADVVHCGRGRSVFVGSGAQEVTLLPQHARP